MRRSASTWTVPMKPVPMTAAPMPWRPLTNRCSPFDGTCLDV
jgi:hypothetical protein